MTKKKQKKVNYYFFILSFILVAIDQASKFYIRSIFILGDSIPLFGNFFRFTYLQNTGVSFGLFKGNNMFFVVLSIIALAYFIYLFVTEKEFQVQYSLVIAGVIGNVIDRIHLGYVVDFIDIGSFPVFNVADSCISVGVMWIIFLLLRKED
jgi:signal peptidase II